ncbi:MAG: hypothetical protein HZR80_03475 [Candidatus Heimdallarchaeota archaeon]
MKKIRDDIGKTIDSEDNLPKMILIEQAIDSAYEIEEPVSRSYAFCDCIIAILEFARETSNEETLEGIIPLLDQINNKGAYARAKCYLAVVLASFNKTDEAEDALLDAINYATEIRDDFDRRDAFLDIATSLGDISFMQNKRKLLDMSLHFSDQLTQGQKAYLLGYLSTIISDEDGIALMRDAIEIANKIKDPITRSKVFLELSSLLTNFNKLAKS